MPEPNMPAHKVILFSLLTFILFFSLCELSSRIILTVKNHSLTYMLYGFINTYKFQTIQGSDDYASYYKGIPSHDKKNPVNSLGFRGPEINKKKDGCVRIVCLGSSTTYGDNHNYSDTYPAFLQKILDARYGKDHFEVINAGMSGFDLNHIIAMTKNDILQLQPDIILVSNVNNNLQAPGFWFVDIRGKDDVANPPPRRVVSPQVAKLKLFLVQHTALGFLIQELLLSGLRNYIDNFDFRSFSKALTADNNIWEAKYTANLKQLLMIISKNNPQTKVILLEEAVNNIDLPEMGKPFDMAYGILREMSLQYSNVYTLDIHSPIIHAAQKGIDVWQDSNHTHDPLHLSKAGNEITAQAIADFIASQHF